MRVEFIHSQEDMVDALLRLSARSKVLRRMKLNRTILMGLVTWFVVVVLFRFSLYGFIAGAVGAFLSALTDPWLYRYGHRKALRKIIKERHGDKREFLCIVELLPEGMKTSDADMDVMFGWDAIEEILETNDSVDIFIRTGICVVRNRAFSSAAERQRFIELGREYMTRSRV